MGIGDSADVALVGLPFGGFWVERRWLAPLARSD